MKKKNIIISSFATIALCLSLLMGSTFALFTSESKVNIAVTSGKVSVVANIDETSVQTKQLYDTDYSQGATNMYEGVATFNADGLTLEKIVPGDGIKFNIVVKNESTVSVKYRTIINCESDDGLFAGLNITVGDNVNYSGATLVSNWAELAVGSENEIVPVTIELPEGAGNEYQEKSCAISYKVEAVQGNAQVENPVEVSSSATFDEIAALIADGKDIYVSESINLTDATSGNTYITVNEDIAIYAAEDAIISMGETTLINGSGIMTVYGGSLKTNHELCVTGDSALIFEGGEHTFGAFSATSNGKIVVNGGTLNCLGTYAGVMGISFAETGRLIVNDGKLNMYQPFNLNANRCDAAYIEINGGTIELLNGIENLFVVRNIMDKDKEDGGVLRGSSIRVTGGTFIAHYEIDSAGDATSFIRNGDGPADTNKVLVSNTFNGASDYDCVVTGGTFYGSWQRADNQRYTNGNGGYSDGLFVENSIAGFVADGYQITGDATNGYIVFAK